MIRNITLLNSSKNSNILEQLSLFEIVNNKSSNIILLGEPGIGKTFELELVFKQLWNVKSKTLLIPIFINIKLFRASEKFESIIPYKEWKKLPNIIFILDGLDEIANVQDFISALEIFKLNNDKKYKYLISCRTNIYYKYLISFNDFKSYILNSLTFDESSAILKNVCGIEIEITLSDFENNYLLQNPFSLIIIGELLKDKSVLNLTNLKIWDLYIEKTLKQHKIKKIKSEVINEQLVIKSLKKVAFVAELQQLSSFTESQITSFLGDYLNFIEYPFIKKIESSENFWCFNHKQIQEYFASLVLLDSNFEKIKETLFINQLNRVNPSFYNLLNFIFLFIPIESDLHSQIFEQLLENEIELIIKSGVRLNKKQLIKVFQSYFQKQCIEKGFWFSTNNSVSEEEFARFGDCDENIDYLISFIANVEFHFRIKLSAIHILGEFKLSDEKYEKLKEMYFDILKSDKSDHKELKSTIIYFFKSQIEKKPALKEGLFKELFSLLNSVSDKSINRSLLGLIQDEQDVDQYIDFIKREFEFEFNIQKRENEDEVFRGNDWILKELILRLEIIDNFIPFAIHFCDDNKFRYDDYLDKLVDRIIYFNEKETSFFTKFIKVFIQTEQKNKRFSEDFLVTILTKLNKLDEGFDLFFDVSHFDKRIHFLGRICSEEKLKVIIEKYDEINAINQSSVRSFRNILSHSNYNLALKFQDKTIELGYVYLDGLLKTNEELEQLKNEMERVKNENLLTLFNSDLMMKKITLLFVKEEYLTINKDIIFELQNQYHENNGWNTDILIEIEILYFLTIKNGNNINLETVTKWIKEPLFILEFIKRFLEKDKNQNLALESSQILFINQICEQLIDTIDFDNVILINSETSFTLTQHYSAIKVIHYFFNKYDLKIDQKFLINSITYFESEKTEKQNFFDFIKSILLIFPESQIEISNQILDNLKNERLSNFMINKHIAYVLENKLVDGYNAVEKYYRNKVDVFSGDENFELYLSITRNTDLLSEILKKEDKYICWAAIKFILSDSELKSQFTQEIEEISVRVLDEQDITFHENALRTLFQLNHPDALIFLIENYKKSLARTVPVNYFSSYNVLKERNYEYIVNLLNAFFSLSKDNFEFSYANTFVTTYLSNLSKEESHYTEISKLLQIMLSDEKEIMKSKQDEEAFKGSDSKCFFINLFIDSVNNSYLNALSNPLDFETALARANEIIG